MQYCKHFIQWQTAFYAEYGKFIESQFSCDLAVWLGERFLAFWRNVKPSSAGSTGPRRGCLTLMMKELVPFKMSRTTHPLMMCHIPGELNFQQHSCENLKSHKKISSGFYNDRPLEALEMYFFRAFFPLKLVLNCSPLTKNHHIHRLYLTV